MSNIHTVAVRVYARAQSPITPTEAAWITSLLLAPRGSYWVPVHTRRHPEGRHVDVQFGSGKGDRIDEFWECHAARYQSIWSRWCDEGRDADEIRHDHADGPSRRCRYGFDELLVVGTDCPPRDVSDAPWQQRPDGAWLLGVQGEYCTGNDRSFMALGPCARPGTPLPSPGPGALDTPTTPTSTGDPLSDIEPAWLAPLADEHPDATLIEYRWRGRVVHRAYPEPDPDLDGELSWEHRGADDWDNCRDSEFLHATGQPSPPGPVRRHRARATWRVD